MKKWRVFEESGGESRRVEESRGESRRVEESRGESKSVEANDSRIIGGQIKNVANTIQLREYDHRLSTRPNTVCLSSSLSSPLRSPLLLPLPLEKRKINRSIDV